MVVTGKRAHMSVLDWCLELTFRERSNVWRRITHVVTIGIGVVGGGLSTNNALGCGTQEQKDATVMKADTVPLLCYLSFNILFR